MKKDSIIKKLGLEKFQGHILFLQSPFVFQANLTPILAQHLNYQINKHSETNFNLRWIDSNKNFQWFHSNHPTFLKYPIYAICLLIKLISFSRFPIFLFEIPKLSIIEIYHEFFGGRYNGSKSDPLLKQSINFCFSFYRNLFKTQKKHNMGCAFASEDKTCIPSHFHRAPNRTIKIDCRKKSLRVLDEVIENIQIISQKIDQSSEEAAFAKLVLSKHHLFNQLSDEEIGQIINVLMIGANKKNEYIFEAGNPGSCFFIILKGSVSVQVKSEGKPNNIEKIMKEGECFGQLSLMFTSPRAASIRILTDEFKALVLKGQPFKKIVSDIRQKNMTKLKKIIERTKIFELLSTKQKMTLMNALVKENFQAGQTIFKQNQPATTFYLIESGRVEVTFSDSKKKALVLGCQQSFGESVLRENSRRQGTAVALTQLACYSINGSNMKKCLGESLFNIIYHNIKKWALSCSPLFGEFQTKQLDYLALQFENKYARAHDIICADEQAINSIYICLQGKINKHPSGTLFYDDRYLEYSKSSRMIDFPSNFNLNDHIQEEMLLKDDDGMYAKIQFTKLQEVLAIMRQRAAKKSIAQRRSNLMNRGRGSVLTLISQNRENEPQFLNFGELEYLKKLGSGQFGMVYLVKEKKSGILFALKCVKKSEIKQEEMVDSVIAERQILSIVSSPFIVGYYNAYEDKTNIYFLLQYINGIEMFEAIREIGILNKIIARYYFGSMIIALEYLHSLNIVYRDLKPENSLVNHQGKVFLIDMGTAKVLKYDSNYRTQTIIGTPHYMAPEAMQSKGYSFEVDFWSLGIVLYEFVCGALPFAQKLQKPFEIYSAIKDGEVKFPNFIRDKDLIDLIKKLLSKDPIERYNGGFEFIRQSKYFQGFKWDDLQNGRTLSPYIPLKFRKHASNKYEESKGYPLSEFLKSKEQTAKQESLVFKEWNSFEIS